MSYAASRPRRTYASRLATVQHVGIEMARTYRQVKAGKLDSADGYRRTMMLAALKACLETSEIERKIAELEALVLAQRDGTLVHLRPKVIA